VDAARPKNTIIQANRGLTTKRIYIILNIRVSSVIEAKKSGGEFVKPFLYTNRPPPKVLPIRIFSLDLLACLLRPVFTS